MFIKRDSTIDEARKISRLPNFIWAIVLAIIFFIVGQLVGILIVPLIFFLLNMVPYLRANQELLLLLITLLSFAFISLVVFFRVVIIEKRRLSTIGFYKKSWFKKYAIGFLIGIVMMGIVVAILSMIGCIGVEKTPSQPTGLSAVLPISILLIGWIVQGATEEILARGWLMNIIGARYNIAIGLIASSTFFGLLHLGNDNVNIIAILNICLVGFLFGIYAIKTNDLWGVCGMHTSWNFAQGNFFGFEVSGINTSIGSLVDLNLTGNKFISGGAFGPEAGFVATVVLTMGILIIFILDKKGKFNQ